MVHACAGSPEVVVTDFSYGAPLYKGNERIVEGLQRAETALERFDVYFYHGFLDETERVRLATRFRTDYLRKHPRSERSDVFAASSDVLAFSFELGRPMPGKIDDDQLRAILSCPHDPAVLRAWRTGERVDPTDVRGRFRLYLDHVLNPRRHVLPDVKRAAAEISVERPVIIELETTGALPGLFVKLLGPCLHEVGGRLVLLPA